MRTTFSLLAVAITFASLSAGLAAPIAAQQQGKKPADRILAWELETFGGTSLKDVITTARPRFFKPTGDASAGARSGWRVLVYIGTQEIGDTTILHTYKASDVKEVRYYRANEAGTRFGTDNASVVLLTLKDEKKPLRPTS